MIKSFSKKALQTMEGNGKCKYYVYRLIDPRNYETFYVGKGCGNRVFQHANNEKFKVKKSEEDDVSLKKQQIQEILSEGKEVVAIIHRWNLTEDEAFEVEAALIDCYPALTNEQAGHGSDYGVISAEDLNTNLGAEEYVEPDEDYVLIKNTAQMVNDRGSLYDAVRSAWKANLSRAKKYKYVLCVVNGIVREVYKVSKWMECNDRSGRIEFVGESTNDHMSELKGKLIPQKYKKRGAAAPFLYKKSN